MTEANDINDIDKDISINNLLDITTQYKDEIDTQNNTSSSIQYLINNSIKQAKILDKLTDITHKKSIHLKNISGNIISLDIIFKEIIRTCNYKNMSPLQYMSYMSNSLTNLPPKIFNLNQINSDNFKKTRVPKILNTTNINVTSDLVNIDKNELDIPPLNDIDYKISSLKGPIPLFDLVLDISSFSKTIENLFYISFPLKYGKLSVYKNTNNEILICPAAIKSNYDNINMNHEIYSLSFKDWQKMVQNYNNSNNIN